MQRAKLIKVLTKKTVFHNCSPQGPYFKENSNDFKDNIINIFDELNNSSTLKDDFKATVL